MKSTVALLLVSFLSISALAAKPCDELKSEIAAKLDSAGVKNYALEIVAAEKAGDAKIVGSCEGGKKKITYAKK